MSHKARHKEGCKFDDYYKSLHRFNKNSSEEDLSISDEGIEYVNDDTSLNGEKDETILFKFCPLCAEPYELNEDIEEDE